MGLPEDFEYSNIECEIMHDHYGRRMVRTTKFGTIELIYRCYDSKDEKDYGEIEVEMQLNNENIREITDQIKEGLMKVFKE